MLGLGHFEVDETHAVEVEAPTCEVRVRQAGHAPFLELATERAPTLLMSEGGAKFVFVVASLTATFTESLSESAGIDEYVSKIPNPLGELGAIEVAPNLAAAINNPSNSLHGRLSATVEGTHVFLSVPASEVFDVSAAGGAVEFLPRFRTVIEHAELSSIAELVGEALGETFEVEL